MTIAVIGNSARIRRLCELLRKDGHSVGHYPSFASLPDEFKSELLITDIPTYKNGTLNLEGAPTDFSLEKIAKMCQADTHIIGCNCTLSDRPFTDINKNELFEGRNAVPSAEGAISIAMNESDITLFGSRTLVIGYGRIAKIIADRMAAFKSEVTVAARREKARLEAEGCGSRAIDTASLSEHIGEFDFIFQTVPQRLIGKEELSKMRGILIEISSGGIGTDLSATEDLSKRVIYAPGIPSKYSSATAAEILYSAVNSIISQR